MGPDVSPAVCYANVFRQGSFVTSEHLKIRLESSTIWSVRNGGGESVS